MSQLQWTFINDAGEQFRVSLYHGDESGHLMVQCNGTVMIIDFAVFSSREYHFMLGEDLFTLRLNREPTRFTYSLTADEDVDSVRNRRRKLEQKRLEIVQIVALAIVIIALIALFIWRLGYEGTEVDDKYFPF
jgi:hypothetical protein